MPEPVAFNIADPRNQIALMREAITVLSAHPRLGFLLFHAIAVFVDGLAKPPRGNVKAVYTEYLQTNFAELCNAISADHFYEHFRNKAIHEFGVNPPYGLIKNGSSGLYIVQAFDDDKAWQLLNIDRLAVDFLAHLDELERALYS